MSLLLENAKYFLDIWFRFMRSFDAPTASMIILALTLLAYLHMLKQTRFQSDLAVSPLIFVEFDTQKNLFLLKNLGKGVALNTKVSPFVMFITDAKSVWKIQFDAINMLEPNDKKELPYKAYENKEEVSSNVKQFIFNSISPNQYAYKNYNLNIEYDNALGNSYYTILSTGKDGIKILAIGRKGAQWWFYLFASFLWDEYLRVDTYCKRRFKYKIHKKRKRDK